MYPDVLHSRVFSRPRSGAKKSSGLSSVLSSIGKKTKMSTLVSGGGIENY